MYENYFARITSGLYRHDGLAIIKSRLARMADKTRKELHKVFKQFGIKITAEANLHVINFLPRKINPIDSPMID